MRQIVRQTRADQLRTHCRRALCACGPGTCSLAGAILAASLLFMAAPASAQGQSGPEEALPMGTVGGTTIPVSPVTATAPDSDAGSGTGPSALTLPDGTTPEAAVAAALSREIARMKAEIAVVARFAEWQERLLRTARVDPDEALRQRLPVSECRASFLAPICDDLGYLFAPEEEPGRETPAWDANIKEKTR